MTLANVVVVFSVKAVQQLFISGAVSASKFCVYGVEKALQIVEKAKGPVHELKSPPVQSA